MKIFTNPRLSRSALVAVLAATLTPALSAKAALYTEDWSGSTHGAPIATGAEYSQAGVGDYYLPVALPNGWTQAGQVGAWSKAGSGGVISGILLNESPNGMILQATIGGFTVGSQYELSFDYWGDNRPTDVYGPGSIYGLTYAIDGNTAPVPPPNSWDYSQLGTVNTFSYVFTASSTMITLGFAATTGSSSEASPILGAVTIDAVSNPSAGVVPEPSSLVVWSLLATVGVALNRRRRKPLA